MLCPRNVQLGASAADVFPQGAYDDMYYREQVGELLDVVVRHSAELAHLFDSFLLSAGASRLRMDRARIYYRFEALSPSG